MLLPHRSAMFVSARKIPRPLIGGGHNPHDGHDPWIPVRLYQMETVWTCHVRLHDSKTAEVIYLFI